ncbi:tetratricopeptide repeat protein [Pseudomonas gingeri]|uniref:Tetratricopeptide repeat protein n=1 Tax=Pseudomonas gingeri TaxID=117681 RepID=A0A7Y7YJ78_9PSED|nr:tetratricopeptide repeat protein [Pseudomonas gingeri]NWB32034.1 tetratricopeptide repeat protein [Pseudomonas gingeri]NWC37511.1 tetratricopeptide repeat protein [Pseudomonas gingeri]
MSEEFELDVSVHKKIKSFCEAGDRLAEQGRYQEAVGEYNNAWILVPEPQNEWEASTWILAAIADACFLAGFTTSAREALQYAMTCPGALGNPFLHLRLGQVLLDCAEEAGAADELMRAYMGAGEEIFATEDSKYLRFLKKHAKL